jgi:hypothetical protein
VKHGDKCRGCGVKATMIGDHPQVRHRPGCPWENRWAGRKPGGQAVPLPGGGGRRNLEANNT